MSSPAITIAGAAAGNVDEDGFCAALRDQVNSTIPRLLPGRLVSRHTSVFGGESTCAACNQPFVSGDLIMADVYQEDGRSSKSIKMLGRQINFPNNTLVMVHVNNCLQAACAKATEDIIGRVSFAARKQMPFSSEDASVVVWSQFRWATRWVAWSFQFLTEGDQLSMQLGSKRPQLTEGLMRSFSLEMTKTHAVDETLVNLLAPSSLFDRSFLEALLTRVYEVDVVYTGKFNAVLALQDALEKVSFKGRSQAFAYTLTASTAGSQYGSTKADQQKVRLLIKTKPDQGCFGLLWHIYQACESLSWLQIHAHLNAARFAPLAKSTASDDPTDIACVPILQAMRDIFQKDEDIIVATLTKANMSTKTALMHLPLADIWLTPVNPRKSKITCVCNVYTGTTNSERPYHFFRDNASSYEHPLLCYTGSSPGLMPVVVASQKHLDEEMKEAGMSRVELPGLTTIRMSIKAD